MFAFREGSRVYWRSAANGTWLEKHGVIHRVIRGEHSWHEVTLQDGTVYANLWLDRGELRFLVEVPRPGRSSSWYMPRNSALRADDTPERGVLLAESRKQDTR